MIDNLTPELRLSLFNNFDTFLIIGAFDGVSHDDVIDVINQKNNNENAKIIFVEPIPEYFERLKNNLNRINSPQDKIFLENSCIGDSNGDVDMVYFDPNYTGNKPWYIEGCACVIENGIPLNMHIREEIPQEGLITITTKTNTVKDILDKYEFNKIDYIQIDTEGFDQRIVESIDISSLGCKYLKFEAFYCSEEFINKMKDEAEKLGYFFYKDWDIHLIKKDLL